MRFAKTTVGGTVEILAADDFVGIPIKLTETGVIKAGTAITAAGAKTTTYTDAAGILLYDVYADENPNGTIVVQGVIDKIKADAHAGVTLDADALKIAVPGVVLRANIGVNG